MFICVRRNELWQCNHPKWITQDECLINQENLLCLLRKEEENVAKKFFIVWRIEKKIILKSAPTMNRLDAFGFGNLILLTFCRILLRLILRFSACILRSRRRNKFSGIIRQRNKKHSILFAVLTDQFFVDNLMKLDIFSTD